MQPEAEIFEADLGDGDHAFVVQLPIAPYGETLFVAPDNRSESEALLKELSSHWAALWPKILEKLKKEIAAYGVEATLAEDAFFAEVSRLNRRKYMADKADIFLRLELDEPPLWDSYIKGDDLVHFQPVF